MANKKITQLTAITGNPQNTDEMPIVQDVGSTPVTRKWSISQMLTWLQGLFVQKNSTITGATKTKITYDSKGLVTAGADVGFIDITGSVNDNSTLVDYIADPTNINQDSTHRFVTDAQITNWDLATNLGYTASPTNGIVTSDTGTDATLTIVDGTNAGLITPTMKSTWDGKRNTYVTDTIATTGSTAIDFTVDGETNITQTGSITFTGSATSAYVQKMYIIKGSRNAAHTFTFPVGWKATNNTLPSSMFDNAISIWTSGSEVFFCVNVFDMNSSSSFDFSNGMILYPELNKIRVYVTGSLDQTVVPNTAWFTATGKTVTAVSIFYNYIDITVNTAFAISDILTVGYTSGSGRLVDGFGNLLTSFSEVVVVEILVSDNFNRADSALTLGNADTGETWQYVSPAVFGISSNRMYCASAVDVLPVTSHIAYIDAGQSEHSVTIDKIFPASTNQTITRVLLRYTDANNHYRCGFVRAQSSTTVTCLIQSVKGGVISAVLATITGFTTVSNGSEQTRTYTCRIKGNTIYVYEDATLLGSYTDNATDKLMTGNNAGVLFLANLNNSSVQDRLDNLYITKS